VSNISVIWWPEQVTSWCFVQYQTAKGTTHNLQKLRPSMLNITQSAVNALHYPQKFTLKGICGYVGTDYIRYVLRNFFPRCRMWWDRYFRWYWLENSRAYPIYCTNVGTISLLYLCMNVFIVISMYERFIVISMYERFHCYIYVWTFSLLYLCMNNFIVISMYERFIVISMYERFHCYIYV
jgi:hypothetical protein